VKRALRIAAQLALYVPLMALIGYFSARPQFRQIGDGEALVRLSFVHAAQRKLPCRNRTPEELAKLAANMRALQDCPRERADVLVELELDGKLLLRRTLAPAGLKRDGQTAVYHRFTVPAGRHRFVARLSDRAGGEFNFTADKVIELAPGAALVIDFVDSRGGFVFRS
jgi:hypothetical protein